MANCRRHQAETRDLKHVIDELRQQHEDLKDKLGHAQRMYSVASNEASEAKTFQEMTEKQKRQLETELTTVKELLADSTAQNTSIMTAKRSLETEMTTLRSEVDEMALALRNAEEKAKHALFDVMR